MARHRRRPRPVVAALAAIGVAGGACAAPASAAPRAPVVEQIVVFKNGKFRQGKVRAAGTSARVGRRRCAVGTGTPLAALLRSKPGSVGLRDYGACSRRRPSSSGQLYVRSVRGDRERGRGGWVYKAGRRLGTAGAADTSGPFGRGRLRGGARLTWFYCLLTRGSCQRTLTLKAEAMGGGVVAATVRGYDDEGRGVAVGGATVAGSGARAVTAADGTARLTLRPGRHTLAASRAGLVRSFGERLTVR